MTIGWLLVAGAAAIGVAIVLALLVRVELSPRAHPNRTTLTSIAPMLGLPVVLLGIVSADSPVLGYTLLGVGVAVSIAATLYHRLRLN
jgi:energy-converting hydrogenase Eha subunit A